MDENINVRFMWIINRNAQAKNRSKNMKKLTGNTLMTNFSTNIYLWECNKFK